MPSMRDKDAVVMHPASLADFVLWILHHHVPPTNLIICSERDYFLQQLYSSTQDAHLSGPLVPLPEGEPPLHPDDPQSDSHENSTQAHPLLARTLHVLAASQTVRVAFCPSVSSLHAYIATLPQTPKPDDSDHNANEQRLEDQSGTSMLALVNLLALHRDSAFNSAQGLSRVLAAAVEAAWRSDAKLVIFESTGSNISPNSDRGTGVESSTMADDDSSERRGDVDDAPVELDPTDTIASDPWDVDIPIVNSSTRTFGVSGERGWMEKTVKARAVVGRWCRFETLTALHGPG